MKDAQKPDHTSLNNLVRWLKEGKYVIPDFQRDFEWKPWDVRDLMRSIFLDYYIGSLLLWSGKKENFESLACEPIYGYEGSGKPEYIVLDGQQRLTAMYYVFCAPDIFLPQRNSRYIYYIRIDKFMEEFYDDAFEYGWQRWAFDRLENEEEQFETHYFPLAVIGKSDFSLPNWLQGYQQYWMNKVAKAESNGNGIALETAKLYASNAEKFGRYIQELTQLYQIAYIELNSEIEIDKVCDIFTQINSKGIRLDAFDLINALLKPKGIQLKHMWRDAASRLDFIESDRLNVYVLQVMSILIQAYCSPKYLYYLMPGQEKQVRDSDGSLRKEILVKDTDSFVKSWNQAVDALAKAIEKLRHPHEYGAIASQFLPYVSILPAFAALQDKARSLPPEKQADAQRKIRFWYWASVFNNRYSGSVESTSARDFLDVRAWFENDAAEPALIAEFRGRFRTLELRREVKRGSSVYNGIFNLLVLNGARDWMTSDIPLYGDLDDHHIVPKSWGKENDLGNLVDSILNRTPLTTHTNRNVIRERLPNEYLPELIAANGESYVREIFESHFISPTTFDILLRNPFTKEDFEAFLDARQQTLQEAIEDLLIKQRLHLPPRLRDLDAKIEQIELGLRKLVFEALGNNKDKLPSHVYQKLQDRLQTATRKNPALDQEYYGTLAGILEYADMRELQDVFSSKSIWPGVEQIFGSKSNLDIRFSQLAELRNSIRHSRTVTEVARKDGEAAILWFEQVLEKKRV
jgi:hypothetical protein